MVPNPIFLEVPSELSEYFSQARHVFCPHYDACLNEAVRRNQYFDCGECIYRLLNIKSYETGDGHDLD
ncbi:MAG: hypothetical protein VR64_16075 [Desulfatitalea sp. BRH_c12]|nr:MAG: hypothetical protein VR64_16075 [Desulfatitalea sp. BRH_c12]